MTTQNFLLTVALLSAPLLISFHYLQGWKAKLAAAVFGGLLGAAGTHYIKVMQ